MNEKNEEKNEEKNSLSKCLPKSSQSPLEKILLQVPHFGGGMVGICTPVNR